MKKIVSMILTVTLSMICMFSVAGCQQKPSDKELFETYRQEQCDYLDSLQQSNNTHEIQILIMTGKNEVKSVAWDESKSLEENKAILDNVVNGIKKKYDREISGPMTFTYTLYGHTQDLGERMYMAEISVGDNDVDLAKVNEQTFCINVEHDANGKVTNEKYYPENIHVNDNTVVLNFGEKGVSDADTPILTDSYTEIDLSIFGMGKTTEKYTVTVELCQAIGDIAIEDVQFLEAARVNEGVSVFEARTITSKSGASVPYRVYEPNVHIGEKAPLILWLNTSAETGNNNYSQVGIVPVWKLTTPEVQNIFGKNGAYVVSTQVPDIISSIMDAQKWGEHTYDNIREAVDDAISKAEGKVDTNRIYVFGGSLGGHYTDIMVHKNPGFFAAAIVCATGNPITHVGGDDTTATKAQQTEYVQAMADSGIAMYFVHSVNDPIANPENGLYSWKKFVELGGDGTLAVCNNVYIEGLDGSNRQKAHETWLHVFNNFNGSEINGNNHQNIWLKGEGSYQSSTYGKIDYTSVMPKDAKGGYADILSWLSAHQLQYSITYFNGTEQITTLTKNTYKPNETFTLEAPIAPTGTKFVGWYDNPDFTGEKIEKVTRDKFDKKYYAKFEQI